MKNRAQSKARLWAGVAMLVAGLTGGLSARQDALAVTPRSPPARADAQRAAPVLTPQQPTYLRDVLPIFMARCSRCHNEQTPLLNDWLNYHTAYDHRAQIVRRIWESWKGTYYKEPMPVPNSPESYGMTPAERKEVRHWFEEGAPRGVAPTPHSAMVKAQRIGAGRQLFYSICVLCHQPSGQGVPNQFPPLAHSDFLKNEAQAIQTVINGRQGPIVVNGQKFNNSMPRFPLSDDDIANVLTFVYNAFGNGGPEVTPQDVARVRQHPPSPSAVQAPSGPQPKSEFE